MELARVAGAREFKRLYGGPILLGPPARRLGLGRVFVVGDAGGLVKPLTGGGLYPNSAAASTAARIASKGASPAKAIHRALCSIAGELEAQHHIARALLENKGAVKRAALLAGSLGADRALDGLIDFDRHETIPLAGLASPLRTAGVVAGVLLESPRLLASIAGFAASLARRALGAVCR
jgi:flavin-dependent dehydrogenase